MVAVEEEEIGGGWMWGEASVSADSDVKGESCE